MNIADKKPSVYKDVFLLFMGALISLVSSLFTFYLSNRSTLEKEEKARKIAFIEEVANNCGHRLFLLDEILANKKFKDSANLKINMIAYKKSLDQWNQRYLTYYPMLNIYFGKNTTNDFDLAIYNPSLSLGKFLIDKDFVSKEHPSYGKQIDILRKNMQVYFDALYEKVEK
jgi:hypothetical protein